MREREAGAPSRQRALLGALEYSALCDIQDTHFMVPRLPKCQECPFHPRKPKLALLAIIVPYDRALCVMVCLVFRLNAVFRPFCSISSWKSRVSLPDPLTFPASAGATAQEDAPLMSKPTFDVAGARGICMFFKNRKNMMRSIYHPQHPSILY